MFTDVFREIHEETRGANAKAVGVIRDEAKRLHEALGKSLEAQAEDAKNDAVVARLHQQAHAHDQAKLIEPAHEANAILHDAPPSPSGGTEQQEDAAAAPADAAEPPTTLPTTAPPAADAALEDPTAVLPVSVVPERRIFDPSTWNRLQRGLAIVGLVIGAIVGRATYRGLLRNFASAAHKVGTGVHTHTHWAAWSPVIGIPWFIAMVTAFFFLFALIGILWEEYATHNRVTTQPAPQP